MLYAPADDMIPLEELYELLGHDDIDTTADAEGQITALRIRWPDASVQLDRLPVDALNAHRAEQLALAQAELGERDDRHAQKLLRRIEGMTIALRVHVQPTWDEAGKAEDLVRGLLDYYERAFFFADGAFYNERGKRLLGPDDSKGKYFARPEEEDIVPEEARERKARSIALLKSENVPTIEHLPPLVDSESVSLRGQDEVMGRALALYCVALRAEGGSYKHYQRDLQRLQAQDAATPDELAFAADDDPPEYLVIKFSQRWEALWLLLWSLSYVKQLRRPDEFCDTDHIKQIIEDRKPETFRRDAHLRPAAEILDVLDVTYRYDWAILDAELYGRRTPAKLESVVVYERHYALRWLTRYKDQPWDHISADT